MEVLGVLAHADVGSMSDVELLAHVAALRARVVDAMEGDGLERP